MSTDDPFFTPTGGDRTILRPTPGGSARSRSSAPALAPSVRLTSSIHTPPSSGMNPLVSAAQPLLTVVTQLRNTLSHPDPDALRAQMVSQVKLFEANARANSAKPEVVVVARYVLCTLIDEAALGTPWGSTSIWNKRGLLITFHNEAWGGEKFFLLLDRMMLDPAADLALLELMYICLALGFQGRYGMLEGGKARVDELRERLFVMIRGRRGEFERDLSPHWRGVADRRNPLIRYVPLWVLSSVFGVLLLALYIGFSYALNRASDPVFAALNDVDQGLPKIAIGPRPPPPAPIVQPSLPTLRDLLAPEIHQGLLDVLDHPQGEKVVIRGDGLFRSGSAAIGDRHQPLLKRIAAALNQLPGQVLVTGHTDNVPIKFNARFPSNWHLSQARAKSVAEMLSSTAGSLERFSYEGRADTEPLVLNNTAEDRARNRRVEILLLRQGMETGS